ncbi:TPA: helix-turn-helix domain-containing protein [Providencia rettgeri]
MVCTHPRKKSGLSQQQISRYERGTQNFTIHRLCIFANVLQCDLDYFLEQNIYENHSLVDINL